MPPLTSRSFRGRRDNAPAGRVPPGQYLTRDFLVLSAGPAPHTPLEQRDFSIVGEIEEPRRWTWEEFRELPSEEVTQRLQQKDEFGFWGQRLPLRRSTARAAVLGRLSCLVADVVDVVAETPRLKTLALDAHDWPGHRVGQHVDVRLRAEDGYQAQRSYSIASARADTRFKLTVERLEDGEVSPHLTDEVRPRDQIELCGPIGG